MKKFAKVKSESRATAETCAFEMGYYLKRSFQVKIAICETILKGLGLTDTVEPKSLFEYLEEKRPVKEEKIKAEKAQAEPKAPVFNGSLQQRDETIEVLPFGRYLVTSAQNNTVLHPCIAGLKAMAEEYDARLIVMPVYYIQSLEKEDRQSVFFDPAIESFMIDDTVFLGSRQGIRLATSAHIIPTAKQPINTAIKLNCGESLTLVASPKAQIRTLVRTKGQAHRWAYTSRSCTQRNYIAKRAGDEAQVDHTFGAIYLEILEDGTVLHQEIVSDENGILYNPLKPLSHKVAALVAGDLHCEKMCYDSLGKLHREIEAFKPATLVVHDTLDFMSRNHHNRASGKFLYQMGTRSVIDDLGAACMILIDLAAKVEDLFIVASNHDDALGQWLDSPFYNPDLDPINSKTYHFLKYQILHFIDTNPDLDLNVFDLACQQLADSGQLPALPDNIRFGILDESEMIAGVEVGQHGHLGSGGARGSLNTFKKYQMPMITGHTHSPLRDGNVLTVGVTGSLSMGYNKGGSAWDRASGIVYASGVEALVPTYLINEDQF